VFHDAVDPAQLDAVTWDATRAGRLDGLPAGQAAVANPTGSRFITPHGVVDRHGKAASPLAVTGKQLPIWADDGRTMCRTTPELGTASGTPAYLETADINGGWRRVGQYGAVHEQSGIVVAACSVLNDRAVVVERSGQGLSVNQLWIVQLSSGRVIWSRSYQGAGSGVTDITASRDGSYVAEGATTCCPRAPYKTTVFGPAGSVVRTFEGHAGGYATNAFSWDGTRMVLASGTDESTVTVVDVQSGAAVWTAPAGLKVAGTTAEPAVGGRLALILNGSGASAGSDGFVPPGDLYLVEASGSGRQVAGLRASP
jgi:WD40 repeat protein